MAVLRMSLQAHVLFQSLFVAKKPTVHASCLCFQTFIIVYLRLVLNTYFIEHLFWTVLFGKIGMIQRGTDKSVSGIQRKGMALQTQGYNCTALHRERKRDCVKKLLRLGIHLLRFRTKTTQAILKELEEAGSERWLAGCPRSAAGDRPAFLKAQERNQRAVSRLAGGWGSALGIRLCSDTWPDVLHAVNIRGVQL